jgi:hypothetical protein
MIKIGGDRTGALHKAWGLVTSNKLEGAYYEFGVYQGLSFFESHRIYSKFMHWVESQSTSEESWRRKIFWPKNHHFYAFDTFAGIPDNQENNENFSKGTFYCSLESFQERGEKLGILESSSNIYFKGLFSDVAKNESNKIKNLQKAVIVNIDCDLYESTVDAFNIIKPKLQQGTVVLMDDYNCFNANNSQGQRLALKEFLKTNKNIEFETLFSYSLTGQAFIVHTNI